MYCREFVIGEFTANGVLLRRSALVTPRGVGIDLMCCFLSLQVKMMPTLRAFLCGLCDLE